MYRYSSYDDWATENDLDGRARMAGYRDHEDMCRQLDDEENEDFDPEAGYDFEEMSEMGIRRLPRRTG